MGLQDWAHAGDILAGVGSILTVCVAYYQLSRWRRERRAEKRSEVAAAALVALHSACDACHDWAVLLCDEAGTVLANPGFTHGETRSRLERTFERSRGDAEISLREVRLAETRALPHLDRSESESLRKVQSKARQIDLLFKDAMVMMHHGEDRKQPLTDLQDALTRLVYLIDAVREDGTTTLTRAARLEPPDKAKLRLRAGVDPPLVHIDTCCINARGRAPSMDAVEKLHADGQIRIVGSTRLKDETEGDAARDDKAQQYENRLEPAVWGVSKWGEAKWPAASTPQFMAVASIMFPAVPSDRLSVRQQNDVMHLLSAIDGAGSYFLTLNTNDFVKDGRREKLESLGGVKIRTPQEFLDEFTPLSPA